MEEPRLRLRVRCRGAVQGVGFRPTVYRIAIALGLGGWVINDPDGATAEVEGDPGAARGFVERLRSELPPLARLDEMAVEEIDPLGETAFQVRHTVEGRRLGALVPPDAALCGDCRREMEDPDDRRYRYAFTTCTNCGPRFSIVHSLPYDRPKTAMACFPLCPDCEREYGDPSDRRFHAEPVCCPACGPRLWLLDPTGDAVADGPDAVAAARAALLAGSIVAIKALGGFQLACRADDDGVVETLRRRKRRPSKPFAVMVRDLETASSLAELGPDEVSLLSSPKSPVVLAARRRSGQIAESVTPGIEDLGLLLPTTPLHVELFRDARVPPLVMTSANLSEEPICRTNREARNHLEGIADLFLVHDRDVVRRVDDSVVRATPAGPMLVRRSRGWVPEALPLPCAAPEPIVAVGGHLQVTACVAVGRQAFLSQHVGDLDSESARRFHAEVIAGLEDFLQVTPTLVAADAHPDYPSSWAAREMAEGRRGRMLEIQHHVAHAASVLAEHDRFPGPGEIALAISLDGTGWGPDGTAWGGEWLSLDGELGWRRLGHIDPLPLVGGEAAVREPWRIAAAALALASAHELLPELPIAAEIGSGRLLEVARLTGSSAWPASSGAGRLFEACGSMLGLAVVNDWEGEAAVRLESLAAAATHDEAWDDLAILEGDGPPRLPSAALLAAAARRVLEGEPPAQVAAGFHSTFCALAVSLAERVAPHSGAPVALGGGCLINRRLISGLADGLRAKGLEPLLPRELPPGDGGLAYGQATIAAVAAARGLELRRLDR